MNCANHPDRERVAFCQDCGKPLCQECTRTVGSAIYCEQSLAERLSGTGGQPSDGQPRGTWTSSPTGGSYKVTGNAGGIDYNVSGAIPPPPPPGSPNPGLAALLGFIPGVGAMYNGQYAKGVVHLVVFAILVSLSNENGLFGLFVFGWIIYQVIEAHHTASARRDGTPLPNPFGLNDLGERLGFGRSWPHASGGTAPWTTPTPTPAGTTASATSSSAGSTTNTASWATPPPAADFTQQPGAGWGSPWESYAVPPVPPYGAPVPPIDPALTPQPNRFPAGAIWLIGLGCFFLIGNSRLFRGFHYFIPFLLIGFGVWLFVQKMTDTGSSLSDDGTPGYQYRLYRALRGSVWIILVGVLFLLDSFNILGWDKSWSLFIIVAGLMAIFQRASYRSYNATAAPYPWPSTPPQAPPPAPETSTSIVPSRPNDQEGR